MLDDALDFIAHFKRQNPRARKEHVQDAYSRAFAPFRDRSIFVGDGYGLRFAEAVGHGFSNTVLSLSALQRHDESPLVVVIVRPTDVEFLLANSTLLRKVSHSSRDLRIGSVRGSFNGSDIRRELDGVPNSRPNFAQLFEMHCAFSWDENLGRLVESTNGIVARDLRFRPSDDQVRTLLRAPERAQMALSSSQFVAIAEELQSRVSDMRSQIVHAARVDNVNLRGNEIERLVTDEGSAHRLDDLERSINGGRLSIDIKTKLRGRSSAPKAYNVDKMLRFLAEPGTVSAVLLMEIDLDTGRATTTLLPILDRHLVGSTRIQHHWAGRGSRGVTQFAGSLSLVMGSDYTPVVDIAIARVFLERLLAL